MTKRSQNDPPRKSPLTRLPVEPDLERDDFKPRLPARHLRDRGGLLGHLKSVIKRSRTPVSRGAQTRVSDTVRGKCHGVRAFSQRVVVKARVVTGSGPSSTDRMRKHRAYLSRSGTGLTGSQPEFFHAAGYCTPEALQATGVTWGGDAHHFRMIISPEHGARLDLEDYVRTVLRAVEADLKTRLEWYGVCHHNTDNAHAHVVLRGTDEKGKPLIISREYLSHGLRHVAEREASLRLGGHDREEVAQGVARAVSEERFTFLDRELVRERDRSGEGVVRLAPLGPNAREFAKRARLTKLQRLAFLESRGLAREVRSGVWSVDSNVEGVLRELAHRRAVERIVAPLLLGREEAKQDLFIHTEASVFGPAEVVGMVLGKGLVDELYDKKFVLISGSDGRNHFIPLGPFSEAAGFESREGQVVRVVGQRPSMVRAEQVIHRYLGEQGGVFRLDRFREHVTEEVAAGRWELPGGLTVGEYVERFRARCASLEKVGLVQALGQGEWRIPHDIVERARGVEEVVNKKMKVAVVVESFRPLAQEIDVAGASWLDRVVAERHAVLRGTGAFCRAVTRAVAARAERLGERGLTQGPSTYAELCARDERALVDRVTRKHGRPLGVVPDGQEVAGVVAGYELLGHGYRMVVHAENGSVVMRTVGSREGKMNLGTAVSLTVLRRGKRRRTVVTVRAGERARQRAQTRGSDN